jgi:hypothetical protein
MSFPESPPHRPAGSILLLSQSGAALLLFKVVFSGESCMLIRDKGDSKSPCQLKYCHRNIEQCWIDIDY